MYLSQATTYEQISYTNKFTSCITIEHYGWFGAEGHEVLRLIGAETFCFGGGNNWQENDTEDENEGGNGETNPTDYTYTVDCNYDINGAATWNTDCQTCIGGNTGITACPPDINNEVQYTCLKKLVTKTINGNVIGQIQDIITKLDKNVNVHIKILDAQTNSNNSAGQTSGTYWTKDPATNQTTGFYTNISLSKDLLLESSQEHTAAVLLHEILHAYFRETTSKTEAFENLDHQTMANDYVKPMADFLSSLYSISLTDATALAWDGVVGTKAFINSSSFTIGSGVNTITLAKQDLQNINTSYVLKINAKGKGLCQ
jgi:hypothetical protein